MTDEETIQTLIDLKLTTMAQAFRDLLAESPGNQRSFTEKIGTMVDREWTERDNRRLGRLLHAARLTIREASLENVWCEPQRGLDKSVMRDLATCQWIRKKHNVIVVGKTGVGKSYLGAALAQAACRKGLRALCTRVPRLVHELAIARADGTYTTMLARLAKLDVLVLDDFLIAPLKDTERRDLLEVLEDRYGVSSTVVTSQVPTKNWHEMLADPTIADAICDRLVHNAHVIALKGPSGRERKDSRSSRLNPQREPSPVASLRHQTEPVASLRRRPGQPERAPGSRRNSRPDRPEYAAVFPQDARAPRPRLETSERS